MYKGNVAKLEADAQEIARRYLAGEISIVALMQDYHVAYNTLMRVLRRHTTPEQRAEVNYARRLRLNRKTRFRKGHPTWNRGVKGLRFSPATEFKAGCLRGAAARNWRPIGTITIRYDHPPKRRRGRKRKPGMPPWRGKPRRWIKIRDAGLPQRRWIPYARWLWVRNHGPIPFGRFVVHIDGDTMNDDLSNLRLADCREHLLQQIQYDPANMVDRRRVRSVAAVRRRGTVRRAMKAALATRPGQVRWDCPSCGNHLDQVDPPTRCAKCGGSTFEKLPVRMNPCPALVG